MHASIASGSAVHASAGSTPAERILVTAHDLFYRDGIRATGIDRIIAESGVAKVTFYRQFASKDALVLAFLDDRHARWMAWFDDALQRHGARRRHAVDALVPALAEWFGDPHYRGCAFINAAGELGGSHLEINGIVERHKRDMVDRIAALLPVSRHRLADARALGLAVDGAIVQAQFMTSPQVALGSLKRCVDALSGITRA